MYENSREMSLNICQKPYNHRNYRNSYNKYKFRIYSLLLIITIIVGLLATEVDCRRHRRQHQLESLSQTKCLDKCSCKWKSGKMTVECMPASFTAIPTGLDSGTQVLYMTGNVIPVLKGHSFLSVKLNNLQRIFLNRCGLQAIDDNAFTSVTNLIELDLSYNYLDTVPNSALHFCTNLRKLNLAHNPIKQLLNDTFAKLLQLQTIDLSDNTIATIEANAFQGLKNLKQLYLSNNRLSYISGHVVQTLPSLYELTLHNNPWNCDCKLRDLRDWMLQHNIPLSYSPNCTTPVRLTGQEWNALHLDDYACIPAIVSIDKQIIVYEGENASIGCVVESIPAAKVDWEAKGRAIRNMSLMTFGRQMYLIKEGSNGPFQRSSTLYIMNALEKDAGSYTCVGGNKAGSVTSNLSLTVIKRQTSLSSYSGEEVAGIVLGTMFIFLLIFIAICVVVLRSKTHYDDINGSNRVNQTNEQNRCQTDERKLLSVHMNHNSYVTSVVTTNHLEMKTIATNDSNHQNNDKTATVPLDDNNCLLNSINDNQNCFKTTNGKSSDQTIDTNNKCYKSDNNLSKSGQLVDCNSVDNSSSRNKSSLDQINSDNRHPFNSNYSKNFDDFQTTDPKGNNQKLLANNNRDGMSACVPTTSSGSSCSSTGKQQYQKNEELFRRRASDISEELSKRFGQQKLLNGKHQTSVKETSQPTVRFSNNAIIYNYQCHRFGHSMESLDSETNGFNHTNDGYTNRGPYDYPPVQNGTNGVVGSIPNRSQVGFSYTMRPVRGSAKQYRRSGGSLAALLAIDARDSPDEGLGDEREYETDILD